MKRLYIVLTVFLSSFLFLFTKEVKAADYTQEIDFSLINNDFISLKNQVEDFINEDTSYSDYYYIFYDSDSSYKAYVFSQYKWNFKLFTINSSGFRIDGVSYMNCIVLTLDSSPSVESIVFNNFYFNSTKVLLYTNFENIEFYSGEALFTLGDQSFVFNSQSEDRFFPLYNMYMNLYGEYSPSDNPVPVDNTPILTNFYTTVIEKINYLCGVIVGNYVYMSIFVIFILIILIELIFRRRL